jgi:hypothetical protein
MLLPTLFVITLNNEPEQSPALKPLLQHHLSYFPQYTFYEKVLPFIKWVRGEVGMFKHLRSWGYFENFLKTTTAAMSGNHRPFMSQRVQFSCTIVRLWYSCRLLWSIYIYFFFFAVTRKPAWFSQSMLWKLPLQCWRSEFLSYHYILKEDYHN